MSVPVRILIRSAVCALLAMLVVVGAASADPLDDLSRDFWVWRVVHQPSTGDDIPRVERPDGWLPEWSPASIVARRTALAEFDRRWRALDPAGWPVPRRVDYRLVGSAIARVRWELDLAAAWRRDPQFYIQQALGPVFDMLLQPAPFSPARADAIVTRLAAAPKVLEHARANLDDARQPFAKLAIATIGDIETRLATFGKELDPVLPASHRGRLVTPATAAARAFADYRTWLQGRLPGLPANTAVGRERYIAFLREVALVPFTP